jgi:hypothetical protein
MLTPPTIFIVVNGEHQHLPQLEIFSCNGLKYNKNTFSKKKEERFYVSKIVSTRLWRQVPLVTRVKLNLSGPSEKSLILNNFYEYLKYFRANL